MIYISRTSLLIQISIIFYLKIIVNGKNQFVQLFLNSYWWAIKNDLYEVFERIISENFLENSALTKFKQILYTKLNSRHDTKIKKKIEKSCSIQPINHPETRMVGEYYISFNVLIMLKNGILYLLGEICVHLKDDTFTFDTRYE